MLAQFRRNIYNQRHPPYGTDMSPSDCSIFGLLKITFQGRMFYSDEEVQEAVAELVNDVGGEINFTQFTIAPSVE